jgi:hypothetical protein
MELKRTRKYIVFVCLEIPKNGLALLSFKTAMKHLEMNKLC